MLYRQTLRKKIHNDVSFFQFEKELNGFHVKRQCCKVHDFDLEENTLYLKTMICSDLQKKLNETF